jgi:hypothetical protein
MDWGGAIKWWLKAHYLRDGLGEGNQEMDEGRAIKTCEMDWGRAIK